MTGSHRKLGLALAAMLLAAPTALAQDLQGTFQQAVDLLARDRKEESLRMFQKVLAMEPTSEQAYGLWTSTDHDVWLEILRERGDIELIGRRLMSLVQVARRERRNDSAAITKLVSACRTDDVIARRSAIRSLAADHGEYAVPFLLGWLGDSANEENRTTAIQALSEMNTDVVLPLINVLESDDAFLRRNALQVLATVGDPRSAGALAWIAKSDADGACKTLAESAVRNMNASGDPCRDLCALGEAYHMRSSDVLADHQWSEVVWNWSDGKLVATETPHALYPDALAKKMYARALAADPACMDAHAGIARASAGQLAAVEALSGAGVDVSAWQATVDADQVALGLSGAAALDAGLARSIAQNDSGAAVVLVRTLAEVAPAPTAAMQAALRANDGAIRSEAAVALGNMATWGKTRASSELVAALGSVAGRDIVRLAFVIDANSARASEVSGALSGEGMIVNSASSGAIGLATLRRMPGVDAVVVADSLPDLTPHQVIDEIRAEPAFANAPIFLVSDAPEQAAEAFGDMVGGVLAGPGDVSGLTAALSESLGADRERADLLSQQAASTLMTLAGTGTDISGAADDLLGALGRADGVAVPAAYCLAVCGGSNHVPALAGVVADGARSEGVREAAGRALASIFGRGGAAGETLEVLHSVAHSDAPIAVRRAAAQALGNVSMSAADRAQQLRGASTPQN